MYTCIYLMYVLQILDSSNKMRVFMVLVVLVATVRAKSYESHSGLKVDILKMPDSCDTVAKYGDDVEIEYSGTLEDGTVFAMTDINGVMGPAVALYQFQVGLGDVIIGWDEGILGMCVGEKRRLTVPPELGYGSRGAGKIIPGGATTIFDIELLSAKKGKPKISEMNSMFMKAFADMNMSTETMITAVKPMMAICRLITSCQEMSEWYFGMDVDALEKKIMDRYEQIKHRI